MPDRGGGGWGMALPLMQAIPPKALHRVVHKSEWHD